MSKERQETVINSIKKLARPWIDIGEETPSFSVKEISRSSNISFGQVLETLKYGEVVIPGANGSGPLRGVLIDKKGQPVSNINKEAVKSASFKRAEREAKYRSRAPNGGPVVKRRVDRVDLEKKRLLIGKQNLKIKLSLFDPDEERQKRKDDVKERLALRWITRGGLRVSTEPLPNQILAEQADILKNLGLWSSPELKGKYAFRLSPDVLSLSNSQKRELEEIASLLYVPGGFLDGSISLFNKISNPRFTSTQSGGLIRRALSRGLLKEEQKILESLDLKGKPFVCRLDLLLNMRQSQEDTHFKIAEIEGDKTHAFGYVSIADFFRKTFQERDDTVGMVQAFKSELVKRGRNPESLVILPVGKTEMFYLKELEIFASMVREAGVNLLTVPETDIDVRNGKVIVKNTNIESNLVVSIPEIDTNQYALKTGVGRKLMQLYAQGKLEVLIPPFRFLASKGLLAVVSNGEKNPDLDETLSSFFDMATLARLRRFIPETTIITQKNKSAISTKLKDQDQQYVIKKSMSSGVKGVALPNNRERQEKFIKEAMANPYNFIVQKKVDQNRMRFKFAEPDNFSLLREKEMFLRVSLFATESGIATVGVTARETPDVHGAKDAIQIPVIFE